MAPLLIGLEEHFVGQAVLHRPSASAIPNFMFPKSVADNLEDLGNSRIENMDTGSMGIQVISHIPAVEPPEICRAVNDQLFEAVNGSNGRYRGFAFLPMGNPTAIAEELERCVKELDFVGALIPNHANGTFYDDEAYGGMFAKAQELDVPLYLHPTPAANVEWFNGNYDRTVQALIAGPGLGWHTEVAMHVLRLYGSGLFDKYPRVKIILGHNGEAVPFMLHRIHRMFSRRWGLSERDFMDVWNENFWITTSGMFDMPSLECCLKVCREDRILYSLDYPFEDPKEGSNFMLQVERSGLVSAQQFEMICSGNAKKLLRI